MALRRVVIIDEDTSVSAPESAQIRRVLRSLMDPATPEEWADEAGVGRATVYRAINIDTPSTFLPTLDTLIRLLQTRNVSLTEFFARVEGLPPSTASAIPSPPPLSEVRHATPLSPASLDDSAALLAANSAAIVSLTRTIHQFLAELRSTREQAPAPRPAASGGDAPD